jgi:hypothetical protein
LKHVEHTEGNRVTFKERIGTVSNILLRPIGAELVSRRHQDATQAWRSSAPFRAALTKIRAKTLLSPERLWVLWQFARGAATNVLTGELAEVGTWRGGAAFMMAEEVKPRTMHVFDTFTGLPEADADRLKKGAFSDTSARDVEEFLQPLGNCRVYQGVFPSTGNAIEAVRFALVHVDVDLYGGTRDALSFFGDRMVPGGVIVVDDYGTQHEGVTRAVDEYSAARRVGILQFARGQCVLLFPGQRGDMGNR